MSDSRQHGLNGRVEARLPPGYRALGALFCLLILAATAGFILRVFVVRDPNLLPTVELAISIFVFPVTLLLLAPPVLLGYYPAWVSRVIHRRWLEAVVKLFKGTSVSQNSHPVGLKVFILIIVLVAVAGALVAIER